MEINRNIFRKDKHRVSVRSPKDFRESIRRLKKKGLTPDEKKSLRFGKQRAKLQLRRDNLSDKERKEFKKIIKIKLPNITKRK